jgi:hypothetical protein
MGRFEERGKQRYRLMNESEPIWWAEKNGGRKNK